MSGPSIIFDDKKIKKSIFYRSRKPFNVSDIDVNKIVISKEVVHGTKNSLKHFTGYNDVEDVLQMIEYLKKFDDIMTMFLRVDDSKLIKKCCKLWKTIKGLLEIEFDGKPV